MKKETKSEPQKEPIGACPFGPTLVCDAVSGKCKGCGYNPVVAASRKKAIHDGRLTRNAAGRLRLKLKGGEPVD